MKHTAAKLGIATFAGLLACTAHAHFRLMEPASWIEEDARGDPQKLAPCGGTVADGGVRTGAVTPVRGGSMLKLTVDETIYHPGHFRVALARRINLLPADAVPTMKETERGPRSASFAIDADPRPPVLLDGLWENHQQRTGILSTELRIPNIECKGCFLQIVQFMLDHPGVREGGFTYHHCAVLDITPDAELPLDTRW